MNKNWAVIPLLILLICGIGFYVLTRAPYPRSVYVDHWNYRNYLTAQYLKNWTDTFPETKGMNYTELLDWLNTKMKYPETEHEHDMVTAFRSRRSTEPIWDNPVSIVRGYPADRLEGERALGRCGEFSLGFLQALFVSNYSPSLMVGYYTMSDGSIGDHVWIELYATESPLYIDPTDACTWRDSNPNKTWNECPHIGNDPISIQNVIWDSVWRIREETVVNVVEEY